MCFVSVHGMHTTMFAPEGRGGKFPAEKFQGGKVSYLQLRAGCLEPGIC